MIIIAIILIAIGIWLLNMDGSYTNNAANKLLSASFHLLALTQFCLTYGLARGIFMFLATLAVLGILFTFCQPLIKRQQH